MIILLLLKKQKSTQWSLKTVVHLFIALYNSVCGVWCCGMCYISSTVCVQVKLQVEVATQVLGQVW